MALLRELGAQCGANVACADYRNRIGENRRR
jgi:hypothetical protein